MTTETETIAPPDAPKPEPPAPPNPVPPPEPFISPTAIYKMKDVRVGQNMHTKVKVLASGSLEVTRLDNEYVKVIMSAADFEQFYVKV